MEIWCVQNFIVTVLSSFWPMEPTRTGKLHFGVEFVFIPSETSAHLIRKATYLILQRSTYITYMIIYVPLFSGMQLVTWTSMILPSPYRMHIYHQCPESVPFFQTNFFKAKDIHKQETRGMSKNRRPLQYFILWILTHVPPIEIVIFHMTNPTEWRNQVDPAECLWGWAFQGLHLPKLSPWETGCVNVWYIHRYKYSGYVHCDKKIIADMYIVNI